MAKLLASLPEELIRALNYDQIATGAGYAQATFFGLLGFMLSSAVAIGTGLVFEGGGPKRMQEEREALEKYYSWIPSNTLDFFRAHEYHDEGHGEMVTDVIKQHCMELQLQEDMRHAVRQRADIMWLQNDCIYNAYVRPSLTNETLKDIEGRLE